MATPGTYISGVGHVGLLIWLIAGWGFSSDPLDFDIAEVSVVSGDEFAALVAATTPNPGSAAPDVPPVPEVEDTPAPPAPEQDAQPPADTPDPVAAPDAETPPPPAPAPPDPVAEVSDAPPQAPAPPPQIAAPELQVSPRPTPREAPRIAPTPVAPPPPDTDIAQDVQQSATPDADTPEEIVAEPQEAAAPQETTTEIVTEAEEPASAVTTSRRPQLRPNRPAPAPEPAPQTEAETRTASSDAALETDDAAVAAALAAALSTDDAPAVPQGPPMTGSEQEGFRVAVGACWNVDPGSEAAMVTVTVAFSLGQDGKVQGDVRQVSASGGSDSAQNSAFQSARRAILRCQSDGYDLPPEKYGQWKDVEITFDPSGMRLR